jgi:hypothetical protein
VADNTVDIYVRSKNSTRAGFASAKADAEEAATGIGAVFEKMVTKINSHLGEAGKGFGQAVSGAGKAGGILGAGSGLLAMAGPLGAAGVALGAFGAIAIPVLTKVHDAQAKLTAAQLQYSNATTKAGRATALKAEENATRGLSGSQMQMMGTLRQLSGVFTGVQKALSPLIESVLKLGVTTIKDLMPALNGMAQSGASVLFEFMVPLNKLLQSRLFAVFIQQMNVFAQEAGQLLGPALVKLLAILMQLFIKTMPSGLKILQQLIPALLQMLTQLVPVIAVAAQVVAVMMKWLVANKLLVPALWLLLGAFVALKVGTVEGFKTIGKAIWGAMGPWSLLAAAVLAAAVLIIKYHQQIWSFIVRVWRDISGFVVRTWDQILAFARAWWPLLLGPSGLIVKYHVQVFGFIQRIWADIVRFFAGIPRRLVGALSGLGQWLWSFASNAMGMLWEGLKKGAGSILSWVQHFASGVVGIFKKVWGWLSPSSVMYQGGKSLMDGLARGIRDHAHLAQKAALGAAGAVSGAAGGAFGSGVSRWAGLVSRALSMLGLPQTLAGRVLYQMQTESGGNPNAQNNWDVNAQQGDPSRGLLQVIGATFARYAGPLFSRGIFDPLANIYAAVNYAMHTYGRTLMSGGMGMGSGRGYAAGGPGSGWAMVGEHGRELIRLPPGSQVYPHGQSDAIAAAFGSPLAVKVMLAVKSGGATDFDRFMATWLHKYVVEAGGGSVQAALGG